MKVTYRSKTGKIIVEESSVAHTNGFVPDYKLRAMALGWTLISVEKSK